MVLKSKTGVVVRFLLEDCRQSVTFLVFFREVYSHSEKEKPGRMRSRTRMIYKKKASINKLSRLFFLL